MEASFAAQQFGPRDGPHPNAIYEQADEDTRGSYETESESDIGEDDESLMTIQMPESIYCDIVITMARGHVPEIMSSLVLTVVCIVLQVLLADTMAHQLAGDGAQLFDMVNITGMDAYAGLAQFDQNSMFDIWSVSQSKGETCDMGVQKKWWACNQLSWSYEADAAGDMDSYFTTNSIGKYQGFLFGGIALFLWMGYQVMELKSILNYAQLLFLPSGADARAYAGDSRDSPRDRPRGRHYVYHRKEGSGHLYSLNLPGKILVLLVIACRLYICYKLTNYGAMFLCYTSSLKDFILNSVALVFVYDVDELFFTVFLSSRKQRRVSTLDPPAVHGFARDVHKWSSGTLGEVLGVVATGVVTYVYAQRYLVMYANAYLLAYTNMCGEPLGMEGYEGTPFSQFTCRDPSFQPDLILRGPGGGGPPPGGGVGVGGGMFG